MHIEHDNTIMILHTTANDIDYVCIMTIYSTKHVTNHVLLCIYTFYVPMAIHNAVLMDHHSAIS